MPQPHATRPRLRAISREKRVPAGCDENDIIVDFTWKAHGAQLIKKDGWEDEVKSALDVH